MDPAESAAASETLAFQTGWGAGSQEDSAQASSAAESQVSVVGESTSQPAETQAESSTASSAASSVASTEPASASESQASSSVAATANDSAPDDGKYKQRWLSQQGTVKAKDTRISVLESQNASLADSRAHAPVSAPSVAESASQSTLDKIDALEDRYAELLQEGKKGEAIEVRKQIRSLERAAIRADITREVATAAPAAVTAQTEQERIQEVARKSYENQPYLDNESPDADIDAILFVQAKTGFYIREGYGKPEALQMAIEDAAEKFGSVAESVPESAAGTQVESTAVSVHGSAEELKNMAAVKTKQTPVKTGQKPKGSGTFQDGWVGAAKS